MNSQPCNCLEKLRLKIDQEMDRLRGEFRLKEKELLHPFLTKCAKKESKLENLTGQFFKKTKDYESSMIV